MKKLILVILMLCLVPAVLGNIGEWWQFGYNAENYQGRQDTYSGNVTNLTIHSQTNYGSTAQPIVYDLDNDGSNEIVLLHDNYLNIYDKTMTNKAQIIVGNGINPNFTGQPFISTNTDFNNTGLPSIILQDNNSLYGLQYNGSAINQVWNYDTGKNIGDFIASCTEKEDSISCAMKYEGGYLIIDFPDGADIGSINISYYDQPMIYISRSAPTWADVNNNGNLELVMWENISQTATIGVYDSEGTRIFGWEQSGPDTYSYGSVDRPYPPIVVNLDNIGNSEVYTIEYFHQGTSYKGVRVVCKDILGNNCENYPIKYQKPIQDTNIVTYTNLALTRLDGKDYLCHNYYLFVNTFYGGGPYGGAEGGISCLDKNGKNSTYSLIESLIWSYSETAYNLHQDHRDKWRYNTKLTTADFNNDEYDDFVTNDRIIDISDELNSTLLSLDKDGWIIPVDIDLDSYLDLVWFDSSGAGTLFTDDIFCGNNIAQAYEVCDGTDLRSNNCSNLGFDAGVLYCSSNCASFETGSCYNEETSGGSGGSGGGSSWPDDVTETETEEEDDFPLMNLAGNETLSKESKISEELKFVFESLISGDFKEVGDFIGKYPFVAVLGIGLIGGSIFMFSQNSQGKKGKKRKKR
jgi:hypothetical protein